MDAVDEVLTVVVVDLRKMHTRTPRISHRALLISFHLSGRYLIVMYEVRTVAVTKEMQQRTSSSFVAEENHLDSYVVPID